MPAVPFHANAISRFNEENKIFLAPNQYFDAKFSRIFTKTKIQHSSGAEMAFGANMSYWPQQLNFAVWCATTGCGISREALDKVPEQIKSFLMFHIYIKVRRILFEMGGIQSEWLFQVTRLSVGYIIIMARHRSNEYAEFGISPSANFRFKEGDNHGLGSVSVYVSYVGPEADHSTAYPGRKKFSDESGKAIKGVLLCSRTLLSSIFCCLLLHNFSLSVSFIKFFTEILFVQIYPLTT